MTLDETGKIIQAALKNIINNDDRIAIPYLKEIEGSTKQRIHNQGKDSNDEIIGINSKGKGRYSPGYERSKSIQLGYTKKLKKGQRKTGTESYEQIYPINLQLKGDLLRAYTVGIEGDKSVLKFQDDFNSNKAAWNEKNFKTDIYRPSDEQLEDSKEILLESVQEVIREMFNQ